MGLFFLMSQHQGFTKTKNDHSFKGLAMISVNITHNVLYMSIDTLKLTAKKCTCPKINNE